MRKTKVNVFEGMLGSSKKNKSGILACQSINGRNGVKYDGNSTNQLDRA